MATHDYDIANQSGAAFRTDLNNALAAIQSNNSNSSSPATTVAYQWWADTTSGTLKIRNSSNNAWIELFQLDGTLTLEDGSNSAPALAFRDDLDTGVFSSASNAFNIATAGVERIEFGTTECVVNDTGADVDFRIEGNSNANLFYVDAGNDRVGIGASSPSQTLEVVGNIGINANLIHNGDTDTMLSFSADNQVDIQCSSALIARFTTNGIATGLSKRIDFKSANDERSGVIANADSGAAALAIQADPDGSRSGSFMNFTVDGSEAMRINSSKSILIGTTSDSIFNDTSGGGFNLKTGGQLVLAKEATSAADPLVLLNDTGQTTNKFIVFSQDGTEKSNIGHAGNDATLTVAGTEAFRIDSSQRILVATSSANSIATKLISKCVAGTSATWAQCGLAITHASGANRKSLIGFGFSGNGGTNPPAAIGSATSSTSGNEKDALVFYTRDVTTDTEPTERMRITPFGSLQVSNMGSFAASDPTFHDFSVESSNDLILRLRNTTTNNPYGLRINFDNAAPNDSTRYFIYCVDSSAVRFQVNTNGGIQNFQSNDSNLCDEREKKNIVSLDTKWDKVKSWELKKFHYNEDADTDDLRYGVIAQQIEEHCPEVLTDWIKVRAEDAVLDEDGNVVKEAVAEIARKGVKEQQMMWMGIKALQEAMARIEVLETKVAALEAA